MKPVNNIDQKISLAHDHLFQVGGAERVLATLANIFPAAMIYTLINIKKITAKLLPQDRIINSSLQNIPAKKSLFKYCLPLMPKIWEKTKVENTDILISSCSGLVKGISKGQGVKHVCYCYAPTRYLWEDKEEYLDNLPEGRLLKILWPELLDKLKKWDFDKAQKVDHFITISKHIAAKIEKQYKRQAEIIYPPIKVDDFKIADEVEDYYLIVSRLRPYKRVDLAIKAFNNLKLPLKIIGSGSELSKLKKLANNNIEFLGELSDEKRNYYLSHCKAFIYPQIEDFGITALEAMASGRPVIALRAGGALETVQEGVSGVFFDEQTWESLAHCILRFDDKAFDPTLVRAQAMKFDEEIFVHHWQEYINGL
jgi:glycosyltransferase involved in cell wall biosynthesis